MTATSTLEHLNMSKEKKDRFIKEYIMFLFTLVAKLQINSPLKFQLLRFPSRIFTKDMLHDPEGLFKFEKIVDKLLSDEQISSSKIELCSNNNHF